MSTPSPYPRLCVEVVSQASWNVLEMIWSAIELLQTLWRKIRVTWFSVISVEGNGVTVHLHITQQRARGVNSYSSKSRYFWIPKCLSRCLSISNMEPLTLNQIEALALSMESQKPIKDQRVVCLEARHCLLRLCSTIPHPVHLKH